MDPTGAGRVRGFRASGADQVPREAPEADPTPADPSLVARTEGTAAPQAEVLELGQPSRTAKPAWWERSPGRRSTDTAGSAEAGQPTKAPSQPRTPPSPPRTPLSSRPGWRWVLAAAAVLLVAIVTIAGLAFKLGSSSASADRAADTPTPTPARTATPLPVTDLYQQVVPSVVLVSTSKGSLGSGVIVTDTGTVLTAHHVISGGGTVSILFADGTKTTAAVASTNPETDTATLTPKKLPEVVVAATLGGGAAVGADVVAIGNPLGLRDSTTTGVVSGLNRTSRTKAGSLSGLIQFDAAVNPGSSGGPLLNAEGLVIGVVVSIADPGGDDAFAGVGFAVPIGTALGGAGDGPGGGPQL